MQLTFSAPDLRVNVLNDGRPQLLSPPGELRLEIADVELQALVEAAAKPLAEKQGARLESIQVDVRSISPKSAALTIRAKARKIIAVSATVSGQVEIDDSLVATVSHLTVKAEGMLAGVIEPAVRAKLAPFEGRRFPLAQNLPPWLAVTDVALITGTGSAAVHRVVAKLSTRG